MERSHLNALLGLGFLGLVLLLTSVGPCAEMTARAPEAPPEPPPSPAIATPPVPAPPPLPVPSVAALRAGALQPISAGTVTRNSPAAAALADGRILLAGGADESGEPTSESWIVTNGQVEPTAPMAQARMGARALRTAQGLIVVVGGNGDGAASAEFWEPKHREWSPAGRLIARDGFALVALPDGKVLAAGGIDEEGQPLTDVQLLDTSVGQWLPSDPLRQARTGAAAVALDDGRVLITGGAGIGGRSRADSELRSADGSWKAGPRMRTARRDHAAVRLSDGRVLVAGGSNPAAELYDPARDLFVPAGNLSVPGAVELFAQTEGGAIAVRTRLGCETPEIERWTEDDGWTQIGRSVCGAATLPGRAGRIFAIGGELAK